MCWLPHSKSQLVSCSWDETVKLWDVETRQPLCTFTGHYNAKVNCIAVTPNGDCMIISGGEVGEDKLVKVWRISNLECFETLAGHQEELTAVVAVAPDGSMIATASMDKTIRTYAVLSI
ncbi:hypothetical protein CEUSTIGMA_g2272.t1 [Chlamydomonas eustigma]|uniref:Uncharacterized protein n=1 Tax=Chlamydomonas eustigma TaxID=1157962 RepID=A0A250WVJ5_9CHLO|nr:hypothetical protein CEUSTIGMA_g2272.t1 [Chlamydomonas eustigma]|eukprot:GAX74825.1 hypothetical protein CEUSTIGMA_g2272.t1 [Chlamydomonas eustigma]